MRPFLHADADVEPHALRVGGRQHGAELGTDSRVIAAEERVPAKNHLGRRRRALGARRRTQRAVPRHLATGATAMRAGDERRHRRSPLDAARPAALERHPADERL